jgi:carbon-monoxide dehydrogenase large subunit
MIRQGCCLLANFPPSLGFSHRVAYLDVPTKTNPLGVKGAGGAGTVGALPAVMNAINDALAQVGVPYVQMPCTPAKIW